MDDSAKRWAVKRKTALVVVSCIVHLRASGENLGLALPLMLLPA